MLRFGAEIVFRICELKGIQVVIINKGEQPSFEEELDAGRYGNHDCILCDTLRTSFS